MKTMRVLFVFAGAFFAAAFMSGQTISEFLIAYLNDNYQTQDGSTASGDLQNQTDTDAYGIFAQVTGTGLSGTYSFTPQGGSPTNISTVETGSLVFENAFAFATTTALFTAYPEGNFSMAIPNTNPGGADTAPDSITGFALSGGSFPNVTMITGGTWSGDKLLIDPTQNYTLNFSAFSGFGAGDKISFHIDGSGSDGHEVESTSSVTSFLISAGDFVLANGNTTSADLAFINGISTNTDISGATGSTAYVTILSFTIQAIPEPSTYAAIFGGLALAGVMIQRHRRKAAAA